MLLTDLRQELARYLADFDAAEAEESFRTWSKDDIDHAIRMATLEVFAARPGRFSQRVLLEVNDGLLATQSDECTDVLQVVGVQWADGTTSANARRVTQTRENPPTTSRAQCTPSTRRAEPGSMVTVTVLPGVDNLMQVQPPLPEGAKLIAICAVAPPLKDGVLDMPDRFYPVVFEWALAHLMATEIESATAGGHSDRHWGRGAEVLGLSSSEAAQLRSRRTRAQ
jgi:hypothetical protein